MSTHSVVRSGWLGVPGALLLGALLAFYGCGLNDVDIPELDGPSTFAANLTLRINPDLLVADGVSTALVTATFFDVNGRPAANREIFFTIADEDGRFAAIGSFPTAEGPGFAVTVRTDGQGIAQVVYQAPPRTDATADQTVLIAARPIGDDASAAVYRTVRLELRSAEPRLFPPNPTNATPTCRFVIETPRGSCALPPVPSPTPVPTPNPDPSATPPPTPTPTPSAAPGTGGACAVGVNQPVLVQTTSFDSDGVIVRYLWNFGNGRTSDAPDAAASYSRPGVYPIIHQVTDDDGATAVCQATVTVVP
jgi:PKD domain-containing protein